MEAGFEYFVGIPAEVPALSFKQALKRCEDGGWGSARSAKQIRAYFVRQTRRSYQDRPVWVIDNRGLPPHAAVGDEFGIVPVDARNHWRDIFDAQTGEWLSSDSVPQWAAEALPTKEVPSRDKTVRPDSVGRAPEKKTAVKSAD